MDRYNLTSITSFNDRIQHCIKLFGKEKGVGTSRKVFYINDKEILKVAFNKSGLLQNVNEAKYSKTNNELFTKVYDYSPDGIYAIEERVRNAKNKDFIEKAGINFNCVCGTIYRLSSLKRQHISKLTDTELYKKNSNAFLRSVIETLEQCQFDYVAIMELCNINNWGVANREGKEQIVILDLGNDERVMELSGDPENDNKFNKWNQAIRRAIMRRNIYWSRNLK